jgi:molybdopterin-guanine dinucleotide biosynthesis protein A
MGADKALLEVAGVPLAARVAAAARAAGADPVICVGGDLHALGDLGLDGVLDPLEGGGPLGGIVTALTVLEAELVLVLACDLVDLDAETLRRVVEGSEGHDAAVAFTDRLEPLCGAWRPSAATPLRAAFATGTRAVHEALSGLDVAKVPVPAAALRNVNRPEDLGR